MCVRLSVCVCVCASERVFENVCFLVSVSAYFEKESKSVLENLRVGDKKISLNNFHEKDLGGKNSTKAF